MSLSLRIVMAYFTIFGVAVYLLLNVFFSELKPGVRQSTEDALVDMSNLLAEMVAEEFSSDQIKNRNFSLSMDRFLKRSYRARIFSVEKNISNIRIYITDSEGIVLYDSDQLAVGQDYSQWNDVYLTLRGQYGARSTKSNPDDDSSSVMHVAAPILDGGQIIGVLTVAKPNLSVKPFIDLAQAKIRRQGLLLVLVSFLVTVVLSYWLTRSIRKIAAYADKVASGERVAIPSLRETELAKLASSIDNMRQKLEGKEYVEKYVHALTHELKSPVSAIKGAVELISPQMAVEDLSRFTTNIHDEVERIDEMINRMLALVVVEKREVLQQSQAVDMIDVVNTVLASKQMQQNEKLIKFKTRLSSKAITNGDCFLLSQAIDNLLQNAIDFSPLNGEISIEVNQKQVINITIKDSGEGIPDYALDKIFNRFYSLPRPGGNKKSSGLGLSFVQQIVELHKGSISLKNCPDGGVIATLTLALRG